MADTTNSMECPPKLILGEEGLGAGARQVELRCLNRQGTKGVREGISGTTSAVLLLASIVSVSSNEGKGKEAENGLFRI